MAVKVKFYGSLKNLLKEKEITISLESGTLADVVRKLADHYGKEVKKELLDKEGHLDNSYAVFINEEKSSQLDATVKEGDEVVITSMLAGG